MASIEDGSEMGRWSWIISRRECARLLFLTCLWCWLFSRADRCCGWDWRDSCWRQRGTTQRLLSELAHWRWTVITSSCWLYIPMMIIFPSLMTPPSCHQSSNVQEKRELVHAVERPQESTLQCHHRCLKFHGRWVTANTMKADFLRILHHARRFPKLRNEKRVCGTSALHQVNRVWTLQHRFREPRQNRTHLLTAWVWKPVHTLPFLVHSS